MHNSWIPKALPEYKEEALPPQVHYFISVCETAVAYSDGDVEDKPEIRFCEGVFDYWHAGDHVAPPPDSEEAKRVWEDFDEVYNAGAHIGWSLYQEFDRESKDLSLGNS